MSSYRFRLQSLLDLRRRQRETEEAKLAAILAERARLVQRRLEMRRSDEEARQNLARNSSPAAADLQAVARYASHVIEACRTIAGQLIEQDAKIEAQRKVVTERKRNEELLLKLREEDQAEWDHAADLALEELASASYLAAWNRRSRR